MNLDQICCCGYTFGQYPSMFRMEQCSEPGSDCLLWLHFRPVSQHVQGHSHYVLHRQNVRQHFFAVMHCCILMRWCYLSESLNHFSRLMTKLTKWVCAQRVKTQISLGIRPAWSESSLCAQWVAKVPRFLHADSKDSDQIWVFAGRRDILLVLSCRGSFLPGNGLNVWFSISSVFLNRLWNWIWASSWDNGTFRPP